MWTPGSKTSSSGTCRGSWPCAARRSPTRNHTSTTTRPSTTRRLSRRHARSGGRSTGPIWSRTFCRPVPAPPWCCARTPTTPSTGYACASCSTSTVAQRLLTSRAYLPAGREGVRELRRDPAYPQVLQPREDCGVHTTGQRRGDPCGGHGHGLRRHDRRKGVHNVGHDYADSDAARIRQRREAEHGQAVEHEESAHAVFLARAQAGHRRERVSEEC